MTLRYMFKILIASTLLLSLAPLQGRATVKSCAEEMPEIEALIQNVGNRADRNMAEHQYQRAQERLAAGKENSCLRYLEAARAAIEASQMHDQD